MDATVFVQSENKQGGARILASSVAILGDMTGTNFK